MSRCHWLKEISAYLDNQLPEKQKIAVEEHLKHCQACSNELLRLKQLSEQLKAWQIPALKPGFDSAVRTTIVAHELERGAVPMNKTRWAILVPSSVLAGILVFVVVGVMMKVAGTNFQGRLKQPGGDYYDLDYRRAADTFVFDKSGSANYSGRTQQRRQLLDLNADNSSVFVGKFETKADYKPYYYGENPSVRRGVVDNARMSRDSLDYSSAQDQALSEVAKQVPESMGDGPVIVINPVLPATGQGDKIIRTALVKLEVEDGQGAYKKAHAICQEFGGYLATSKFYKDKEGREAGTLVIRIPKDKFTIVLDKLNTLGKVENITTDSQDVAQEYANLNAELEAAMVAYNKTLEALQKRQTTINEAVRLESQLTPIMKRVQLLRNKIEYLNNAVSFTTITVDFHEPAVAAKVLQEAKQQLKTELLKRKIHWIKTLPAVVEGAVGFLFIVLQVIVVIALIVAAVFGLKYLIIQLFKRT